MTTRKELWSFLLFRDSTRAKVVVVVKNCSREPVWAKRLSWGKWAEFGASLEPQRWDSIYLKHWSTWSSRTLNPWYISSWLQVCTPTQASLVCLTPLLFLGMRCLKRQDQDMSSGDGSGITLLHFWLSNLQPIFQFWKNSSVPRRSSTLRPGYVWVFTTMIIF